MRYTVGVALFFAPIILLLLIFGNFDARVIFEVLDFSSLLSFIIVIAVIIFLTGESKTYTKAINALLSKRYIISAVDKEKAIGLFKLIGKSVIYTAILTMIMGFVIMLGQIEDISTLGPIIAVSLLSLLYGVIINLIFVLPAIHILKNRPDPEPVSIVISEKQVIDKLLELCYKQGISPEQILDAKEISFYKEATND